jgi:Skp family chaperone for outer membrane proteins
MRRSSFLVALLAGALLSGCIARTAANVVTAPVRVTAKAVDVATTSQSEADEKRGRELRKREEELGKLERRYEEQIADCQDGNRRACSDAQKTYAEIQIILPTIPAEPGSD